MSTLMPHTIQWPQVQDLQRSLVALRGRQARSGKALAEERDSAISSVSAT